MKPQKKILTLVLAALIGTMGFAACKDGGEPFEGTLSTETFETQTAAVEAFLDQEIDGLSTQAELVEYVKEADLSAGEIEELPLGEAAGTITRAERGTVSYKTRAVGGTGLTAETDNIKTHALYLLESDGKFLYFVPPTEIGQPVTKSYFNSLFSAEKYANCTLEQEITKTSARTGQPEQKASLLSIMKAAEDAAEVKGYGADAGNGYYAIKNGKIYLALYEMIVGGSWKLQDITSQTLSSANKQNPTMGNLISSTLLQGGDFSYFERTENGLTISEEKYQTISAQSTHILNPLLSGLDEFQYDYIVRNNRIEEVRISGSGEYPGGSGTLEIELHYTLKDFGTTEVSLPDELKAELDRL